MHTDTNQKGFTLLELLVVVFLIGLISGVAVLSVSSVDGGRRLELEAQRIGHLFSLASQEAILQARPIGVVLDNRGYRFLIAGVDEWVKLESAEPLANRELPTNWRLEQTRGGYVSSAASEGESETKVVPHIVFYPTGQVSPFELWLHDTATDAGFRIEGLATGKINLHQEKDAL